VIILRGLGGVKQSSEATLKKEGPVVLLVGALAVLTYLLLGRLLPRPAGERYGSYLVALFRLGLSANDVNRPA